MIQPGIGGAGQDERDDVRPRTKLTSQVDANRRAVQLRQKDAAMAKSSSLSESKPASPASASGKPSPSAPRNQSSMPKLLRQSTSDCGSATAHNRQP